MRLLPPPRPPKSRRCRGEGRRGSCCRRLLKPLLPPPRLKLPLPLPPLPTEAAAAATEAATEGAAAATEAATDAAAAAAALTRRTSTPTAVVALIDGSALDDATKTTLKTAVEAASANPALVADTIAQVKTALGM